jgi:hypothetical protein
MKVPRNRRVLFTFLSDKVQAKAIPSIVIEENERYMVQVLSNTETKSPGGSFVETLVEEGHPLHAFYREKVGMLNLAGPEQSIEEIGENFGKSHYNVYITKEQHALICGKAAA